MLLSEYFSDKALVTMLCRIRIKEADKAKMVANGFNAAIGQTYRHTTSTLLPPRRLWNRYRPRNRSAINSARVAVISLQNATMANLNANEPWTIELHELMHRIRRRALESPDFSFRKPRLRAVPKKGNTYRPLASFELEDKLIDGALAKYWKDQLDELFEPASMAFRVRPTDGRPMPSTHVALELICERRDKSQGKPSYVAECDIKGFFDCVDHEVARTQLRRLIELKQAKNPSFKVDPRAIQLFDAFLDCYSFRENVLEEFLPGFKQEKPDAEIKWPEKDLKLLQGNFAQARIGVPQGGAMSGIIANIVLDLADKQVKQLNDSYQHPTTYLRYCDDMVILADSQKQCSAVFKAYLNTLNLLKLPYHEPKEIRFYDRTFWEVKSRLPYQWSGRKWFNCVPWIQFVGYQIRYDGLVRIRKESEAKHIGRVIEKTGWFINSVLPNVPRSRPVAPVTPDTPHSKYIVMRSLYARLSAMGTGRDKKYRLTDGPRGMCWAAGFKGLHKKPFIDGVLKRLDKIKGRQWSRLNRKPVRYSADNRRFHPSQRAYQNSYHAQFSNNGGDELIKNPYKPSWIEQMLFERLYLWRLAIHLKEKKKTEVRNKQHLPTETPAAHQ